MATSEIKDLKIELTDVEPCVKKISIEIPESSVSKEYDQAFNKARKNVSIQGFRKGKVPKEIVAKMYSESILWDIAQKMIGKTYEQAISENKIKAFGDPAFEDVKVEVGKPISFSATVEVVPEFELPDYSKWSFKRKMEKIDKKAVEAPVKASLEQSAELKPADDRAVKDEDYVIVDYQGTGDGIDAEKLAGKNQEMMISTDKGNVLLDFHKNLIGMKKDEEKEFSITLSKQFPDPAISGKKADFKVKVLSIKEKVLPELNDEFVKANTPYENVEDMEKKVRENLEENAKHHAEEAVRAEIIDKFIEKTKIQIPPKMLEEYVNMHANRLKQRASYSGMELEKTPDFDQAEFDKSCKEAGEKTAKEEVLVGKIAEVEKISPDAKAVKKLQQEYSKIFENSGSSPQEAGQRAFNYAFKEEMTNSIFSFLLSKVKIEDEIATSKKETK